MSSIPATIEISLSNGIDSASAPPSGSRSSASRADLIEAAVASAIFPWSESDLLTVSSTSRLSCFITSSSLVSGDW
jgi:hypothetical protein